MDRKTYLHELRRELKNLQIEDIDEIVAEYEQHIAFKTKAGEREEEVISAMPDPRRLAAEFTDAGDMEKPDKSVVSTSIPVKTMLYIGVVLLVISLVPLLIVFATVALTFGTIGFCLIGKMNIASLIPVMPYAGAVTLGLAMFGFAVTFAVITVLSTCLLRQFLTAFSRRYSNKRVNDNLAQLPWVAKISWRTKVVFRWSVSVGVVLTVIGYAVLAWQANAFEFWHVWNWFV